MKVAFVTGATGFIGYHVVQALLEQGWQVRALRRESSRIPSFPRSDVQWELGDIRNLNRIRQLAAGCRAVFHVAADYRLWSANPQEIYESNVGGTANILEAALAAGVERVVYTSSVGALGLNKDSSPADENTKVSLTDMVGHYKRSKFLAEREAERFLALGLPLIIVNPSTPVGPGDWKPTPTGKIIVDFLNRRMPAYLDTGLNLVHVKDVALGHLLAMERGRIGEKYILGNRNLTLAQIFLLLEQVSGVRAPHVRLPHKPILYLAHFCEILSRLTRKEPLIPLEGVKMAHRHMFFDCGKAKRELGLPQTPVEDALREAVVWFRENDYVRQ